MSHSNEYLIGANGDEATRVNHGQQCENRTAYPKIDDAN